MYSESGRGWGIWDGPWEGVRGKEARQRGIERVRARQGSRTEAEETNVGREGVPAASKAAREPSEMLQNLRRGNLGPSQLLESSQLVVGRLSLSLAVSASRWPSARLGRHRIAALGGRHFLGRRRCPS